MKEKSIVMLGATGAVGTEVLNRLIQTHHYTKLTLLGRKKIEKITLKNIFQHEINIFNPISYDCFVQNHDVAICTLGVGEPSKVSKDDFIKIDQLAVIDFAKACKNAGVKHFQLLASVGIDPKSSSFYLRVKGELVEELKQLNFERLSIFQPSMILTAVNRYGFLQAVTLFFWPLLSPFLIGNLKKFRGIKVEILGRAIANNYYFDKEGVEMLTWSDFQKLNA